MRTLLLLGGILLGLLTSGCVRRAEPPRLDQPAEVEAAILFDAPVGDAAEVPAGVASSVERTLARRNLVLDLAGETEGLERRSNSRQRFVALIENADAAAKLGLLVELRATFDSMLEGKFRWIVSVRLTMGRVDAPELAADLGFDVPVFLNFAHEREAAALAAAAAVIERRLGRLVDETLQDPDAPWATPSSDGGASLDASEAATSGGDLIYLVMVDRFANGDVSNDGDVDPADPAAFHGGDLRGVVDNLDYLHQLGVETVWLTPITDCRDEPLDGHGAFHCYWLEDAAAPEPRFGDWDDVAALRQALDQRGMKLVLDVVTNHLAYEHPWVESRPEWFHPEGTIEDWADELEAQRGQVHGLPDLAQENPDVVDWLLGGLARWQEVARPDGLRLDAVRHVPDTFWRHFNEQAAAGQGSDFLLIGELFEGDPKVVADRWRSGGFRQMFDFPLYYAMRDVFCDGGHPGALGAVLSLDRVYPSEAELVTFADNHDLPRLQSACNGDAGSVRSFLSFQLAARGRPSLTWGTEVALAGAGEPENRADMRFVPEHSLYRHVQALSEARAGVASLRSGVTVPLALGEHHFSYLRLTGGDAALVVVNRGPQPHAVTPPDLVGGSGWRRALDPGAVVGGDLVVGPGDVGVFVSRAEQPDGFAGAVASHAGLQAEPVELVVEAAVPPELEGAELRIVGLGAALGDWSPDRAAVAEVAEGAVGSAAQARWRLRVPAESVLSFKLVATWPDGRVDWEAGRNRYHLVAGGGSEPLRVVWSG